MLDVISWVLHHGVTYLFGMIWLGIASLFALYFYNLRVFRYKAVVEDRKEYKESYRWMDKNQRPLVLFLIMFLIVSFILVNEFGWEFAWFVAKGSIPFAIAAPIMHRYYGNEKRFKFSAGR